MGLNLDPVSGQDDAEKWEAALVHGGELALAEVAEWGPAEEWSDWAAASSC